MVEQELQTLYWTNAEAQTSISELVAAIRIQNERIQRKEIPKVTEQLKFVVRGLMTYYDILQEVGLPWNVEYFYSVLSQIEEAQSMQDGILMGDLYELLMIPILQDIQNAIRNLGIPLVNSVWLEKNLEIIKKKNDSLYQALLSFDQEKREINYSQTKYLIEPTTVGYYTMALEENGRHWYLHSNRNPVEEARRFANRVYRLEQERYLLIGWGMGYIVRELLNLYSEMNLIVVEPDLAILYYAFTYGDWHAELEQVSIVWDPQWEDFDKLLQENREMILFLPELSRIQNDEIKKQLLNIAARKDGIDYHEHIFYQNARGNIRSCTQYIDVIRPKLEGKRVIIVAGGPSLDKNIQLLKKKPQDVIILAVGTVFKLLLQQEIPIDYVIVSDCAIYEQIKGLEDMQVPILILATADRRVSANYKGSTYLICQKGYEMAANYAVKHGYQCYESGGSVATLALDVAIRMKATSIAFVGLDLAFDGNRSHAIGTGKEFYGGFEYQKVEGIDGNMLNTSQSFVNYKNWMERRICREDVDMPIIDATEGGAKKEGFQNMRLRDYLDE